MVSVLMRPVGDWKVSLRCLATLARSMAQTGSGACGAPEAGPSVQARAPGIG
jgi:hypothetical protein